MEIDPIELNQLSLSKPTENCSMDMSFETIDSINVIEYEFSDSFKSSKSQIINSESNRSSESNTDNSICFNNSIMVMLNCEENGLKSDVNERNRINRKRSSEPIEDLMTIVEIDVESVKRIVENNYSVDGLNYCIIDCRFPFEFNGGHISGSLNLFTPLDVLQYFYGPDQFYKRSDKTDLELVLSNIINLEKFTSDLNLIFHCEFSSVRAPKMAQEFRGIDRFANLNCYPHLFYPKIFILKGGYRAFYMKYKEHCQPCGYRRMDLDDNLDTFAPGMEMARPNQLDFDTDRIWNPTENLEGELNQMQFFKSQVESQFGMLTDIRQSIILQRKEILLNNI